MEPNILLAFVIANSTKVSRGMLACWHLSDLPSVVTMSVFEGRADFPIARPDF